MTEKTYRVYNAPTGSLNATESPLSSTANPAFQSSSSTLGLMRTMLQIGAPASGAGSAVKILGWGYTFLAAPATNCWVDLIDSGTVPATGLTAHVAAALQKMNGPLAEPSSAQLGTALTGYCTAAAGTATSEGTLSANATRLLDGHMENGLSWYWRFELGFEPEVAPGYFARLRCAPGAAVALSMICWIDYKE